MYRRGTDGAPEFVEVAAPTDETLLAVLHKIITRTMKLLTLRGLLIEEQGQTCRADNGSDSDEAHAHRPLQTAACAGASVPWQPVTREDAHAPGSEGRLWTSERACAQSCASGGTRVCKRERGPPRRAAPRAPVRGPQRQAA